MSFAAILLYPGCIFFEIALAAEVLAKRLPVRVYTPTGTPHHASNGMTIQATGSLSSLAAEPAVAVLVPGGDPRAILIPEDIASGALRSQYEAGAIIAGICAGNLVIAASGLLDGKRGTHNYTSEHCASEVVEATSRYWQGMLFERADLIRDGRLITAQPWAYRKYAAELGKALELLSNGEAEDLARYTERRTYGDA